VSRAILSTILLTALLAGPALAQAPQPLPAISELKAALAPGKQVLVARQLALTSAEEADFWPVYDDYQRELQELQQRRKQALAQIAGADPERLDEIAEELVQIEADEAELQDSARSRLRNKVSADKVVHYLRLEQRIATLQRTEES
jgi:Spy/CpxP family protein refolding chaperone